MKISDRRALTALVGVFCLSRVVYYLLGVRFIDSTAGRFMHYVDPVLLKNDLARSLFYLHSQPPLFNLYLGLVFKAFPGHAHTAFHVTYLILGLALCLSLYGVMRELGVAPVTGAALTGFFMVSPPCILYENWLYYDYPLAALLCCSAYSLTVFLRKPTGAAAGALFFLAAGIALIRCLFHAVWVVAIIGALLAARRGHARAILTAAAVPLALVLFVYAKNLVCFGQPAASSWMGMNLAKVCTFRLPLEERERLIRSGVLSGLATIMPWSPPEAYRGLVPPAPPTGIPVLDQVTKSTGKPNFNSMAYLAISRAYLRDAIWVITHRPAAYIRGSIKAYRYFCWPSSNPRLVWGVDTNISRIRAWDSLYSTVVCGRLAPRFSEGFFIFLAYALAVVLGLRLSLRRRPGLTDDRRLLLLFLLGNIIYVTLVGNASEVDENWRYRFTIDPLCLAVIAYLIQTARQGGLKGLLWPHRAGPADAPAELAR